MTIRPIAALFIVSALIVGCAGDDSTGESTAASAAEGSSSTQGEGAESSSGGELSTGAALPDVSYVDEIQPLWNAACTCHLMGSSGTMTAPYLTLNPETSFAQLVGVPAEQAALARVAPSDLEASYLWLKLTDTHAEVGEGTVMPQTGGLPSDQLELVRAWILGGANP